jgi:hypothetical protein
MRCADGQTRRCYPTLCAILADCTRCTVAQDDSEDLSGAYPSRTELYTRAQQSRDLDRGHDDFVHPVNCFGWRHPNFNIHKSLATDTLHLLLKGLVMKIVEFVTDLLNDRIRGRNAGSFQLDGRFR